MKKIKRTSLKAKLKSAVTNLKVDVFGIEKIATARLDDWFADRARGSAKTLAELEIRLAVRGSDIDTSLWLRGEKQAQIETAALFAYFAGSPQVDPRIVSRARGALNTFADAHAIAPLEAQLRFRYGDRKWRLWRDDTLIALIPVREIIQHFVP